MSDGTLRKSDRAWRESGTVEDEAVFLAEQVRAGALDAQRLDTAAALGHPAARTAVGLASSTLQLDLHALEREARVRALLAVGDVDTTCHDREDWQRPEVLASLALEEWVLDPVPSRLHQIRRAVEAVRWTAQIPGDLKNVLQGAAQIVEGSSTTPPIQVTQAAYERVARDVVPWALGRDDVLRRRSNARRARAALAWDEQRLREVGFLVYESLSAEDRVRWVGRILAACLERHRPVAEIAHVLDLVADPDDWRQAHAAFSAVRQLTLQAERGELGEPIHVLGIGEIAAKVIYNASGEPAPFDHDSGWWVPECAWHASEQIGDPALAAELRSLILFESGDG